nr:outer membrane protein assembly factor BamE [Paracandidimonas lactea]
MTTAISFTRALRAGLAAGVIVTALAACGSTNWGFPYRPTIQQGNWITSEQVARLQPGMTREQVRFILGTPTLQDIFHADRWDYPYYNNPGYGKSQQRNFTVWFEGDTLVRWEGDEQPDRQPFQKADTGADAKGAKAESTTSAQPTGTETGAAQTQPVQTGGSTTSELRDGTGTGTHTTGTAEGNTQQPTSGILNNSSSQHTQPGAPSAGRSTSEPLR